MAIEAVAIAAVCGVVLLAICALIFSIMIPKRVKMVWMSLAIAERVLKMTNKYKKGRKKR